MSAALIGSVVALCAAHCALAVLAGLRSRPSRDRFVSVAIPRSDVIWQESSAGQGAPLEARL